MKGHNFWSGTSVRLMGEVSGVSGRGIREGSCRDLRHGVVRTRSLEKELASLYACSWCRAAQDCERDGGRRCIKVMAREVPPAPVNEIRNMADVLRQKMGSGVVVLGSREGGEGHHRHRRYGEPDRSESMPGGWQAAWRPVVGGGGGGRPDFAQAGGKEPDKLPMALDEVSRALSDSSWNLS